LKNKTFLSSVRCAFNGLFRAIIQEKNYMIYFLNVAITAVINICFKFSAIEFLIWGITIAGVFSAECINTAIERLCDYLTEEKNEAIKFIKDVAAGAVLCWGGIFYLTEIVLVLTRLI
jgi:diacylglycerol kinase